MLQIRLSKATSSDGGGSKPAASVSCPDYLVLADLPVAKTLGGVATANAVKLVGRRSRRQVGAKVHFCVRCNLPIAIYGRLSPCEHAFCLTCARSDSSCYLCDERIQKIQSIKMLEGIFICAAPHCLKSFLKRMDFELHLIEIHSDLLQCIAEKDDLNEKDVMKVRPVSSDPQPKKLSSQAQSKASSGTQQQEQEQMSRLQTQQKQFNYNLQPQGQQDYQGNSGDNSQQLYQEKQREFERSHHQSHQEKRQKHTHGEKHRKHHDKRQDHADKQYQQEGGSRHKDFHQMDAEHQNVHGRQAQKEQTPKPESPRVLPPSFPIQQPLQYPYHLHPEGFQQHYNPHYDQTQSITFLEGMPIQTGMQSFQTGNQGMPIHAPPIQGFQENHFQPWHIGPTSVPHEDTTAVHAIQEGGMAPNTQGQFSNFAIDYVPGPPTIPLPPPLPGMGMGLDQPVHYQDSNYGPPVSTPHKRDKYMNMHTQGEDARDVHNHGGRGGRSSFGPNHG
ncbi:hypothetical protein SUGI_0312700 [Cryptomeria japonica]|uniref:uncharacterized protein LOC131037301 isoform X2 n=1 Tax=Cryptomeria japonica TaxID=3369 RepID=UPI002408EE13|nr:uncharacterized protein LOC131037301 isoform X2 [Cryptomeria japonica]GLJ17876.1 hypothetical protein SUGI_0312700 [Cryptomeria japonica]